MSHFFHEHHVLKALKRNAKTLIEYPALYVFRDVLAHDTQHEPMVRLGYRLMAPGTLRCSKGDFHTGRRVRSLLKCHSGCPHPAVCRSPGQATANIRRPTIRLTTPPASLQRRFCSRCVGCNGPRVTSAKVDTEGA